MLTTIDANVSVSVWVDGSFKQPDLDDQIEQPEFELSTNILEDWLECQRRLGNQKSMI